MDSALDVIARLTNTIGTARTMPEVYEAALAGIREGFGADRASILLFDADGVLRFKAWRGLSAEYRQAVEGHTPWVSGQPAPDPIVVRDVRDDASLARYFDVLAREGIVSLVFVPLVASGRVIGKFMLYRDVAAVPQPEELRAACTVGALIGFAVERMRLLADEAILRERLGILTDGAPALLQLSSAASVAAVLDLAVRVVSADGYAVWRRTGSDWRIVGSRGLSAGFTSIPVTSGGDPAFDEPIVATDAGSHDRLAGRTSAYTAEGIHALTSIPLAIHGVAAGAIVFYFRESHTASDAELRVATALGHLAAAAISNAELYEEQRALRSHAEAAQRRAAFLAEAGAKLASLDYEGNLKQIARLAVPDIADWCAVDLLDQDGTLSRIAVAHVDPDKVADAEELHRRYPVDLTQPRGVGQVLRSGEPELYPDITDELLVQAAVDEDHLRVLRDVGLRSAMLVPLTASRVLGVLTFVSVQDGHHYNHEDLAFAMELGRRAAFAIENARLYEQVQDANRLKDEFLATLSHELRTPLNVVQGRAHMLTGATELSTVHQVAEAIERNSAVLARLVDDLLDVSRMTVGQISLQREAVSLSRVVDGAVQAVHGAAQAKRIQLTTDLPDTLPLVLGDPMRLQQIVWNLLTNAIKFTPSGGQVRVCCRIDGDRLAIAVADSGKGIAPAELPRVFDMFWQSEHAGDRTSGGLGLGLSIVRRLAELHGGDTRAESAGVGKGATFTVYLPSASVTA